MASFIIELVQCTPDKADIAAKAVASLAGVQASSVNQTSRGTYLALVETAVDVDAIVTALNTALSMYGITGQKTTTVRPITLG